MRKVVCSLLPIVTFIVSFGQQKDYIKPSTFTLNYLGFDFKTSASLRGEPLLASYSNFNPKNIWSGVGISFMKGISKNIDFVGSLDGAYMHYPLHTQPARRSRHLLLAADAAFNVKMLSDKHALVPYLTAGVGVFNFDTASGGYIPLGVGLQYNIKNKAFILLNAQYRLPIGNEANYHFFYSLGVGIPLIKHIHAQPKKVQEQKALPVVPTTEPVVVTKPVVVDTDGDGIVDSEDKCPTIAGLAKYKGCPIPDTDGDGVNDEEDRCPTVPGLARYQGCPIPDTDGDGLNDEVDKCPTVAGPISNGGCPIKVNTKEITKKIEMAAKEIYFETAKAILLPKSFPNLDAVVALMKANESIKIEVDGHTDNVGTNEHNQALSENRAAAVVKYIVAKGIAQNRLVSKGFGASIPIDNNDNPTGRSKNRRVEMKIIE